MAPSGRLWPRCSKAGALSLTDPPKNLAYKRRKARPAPLHLGIKANRRAKHRPPTPYPWRLRPDYSLEPSALTIPSAQYPPAKSIQMRRGRPKLIDIQVRPRRWHGGPSDLLSGDSHPGCARTMGDARQRTVVLHASVCHTYHRIPTGLVVWCDAAFGTLNLLKQTLRFLQTRSVASLLQT